MLIGSGVAAAASLALLPTPAQAAWSDCPSGRFCIWAGSNGSGTLWSTTAVSTGLGYMQNDNQSYWNRTGYTYEVCKTDLTVDFCVSYGPGGQGNFGSGLDNQADLVRR